MSLLVIAFLVLPGGCSRLNPDWCDEHANCTASEYCDPETNTCRVKPDAAIDMQSQAVHDLTSDLDLAPDHGATIDGALDSGVDSSP